MCRCTMSGAPTHVTFGYRQNAVHRVLTFDAPALDAIIQENFTPGAIGDMDEFYAAKGNPEKRRKMRNHD